MHAVLVGTLLLMGSACSVGRKSAAAGLNRDQLSEAVVLNRVLDNGNIYPHYGEFQLQLNLDKNFAYLDVQSMADGWTASITYRVVAKRYDGTWWVLAEGLDAAPGQTIEVDAHTGHKIYEYTEWVVEFERGTYGKAYDYLDPDARMVQDTVYWPQLDAALANQRR
ncbi:MAG: hypothetical protein ABIR96_11650 [Bdellovibrionota bacterium]